MDFSTNLVKIHFGRQMSFNIFGHVSKNKSSDSDATFVVAFSIPWTLWSTEEGQEGDEVEVGGEEGEDQRQNQG